jgi:hypothetical protein
VQKSEIIEHDDNRLAFSICHEEMVWLAGITMFKDITTNISACRKKDNVLLVKVLS